MRLPGVFEQVDNTGRDGEIARAKIKLRLSILMSRFTIPGFPKEFSLAPLRARRVRDANLMKFLTCLNKLDNRQRKSASVVGKH